jgi:hypothetical protein
MSEKIFDINRDFSFHEEYETGGSWKINEETVDGHLSLNDGKISLTFYEEDNNEFGKNLNKTIYGITTRGLHVSLIGYRGSSHYPHLKSTTYLFESAIIGYEYILENAKISNISIEFDSVYWLFGFRPMSTIDDGDSKKITYSGNIPDFELKYGSNKW